MKIYMALGLCVLFSGCAMQPQRDNYIDIVRLEIDCANAEAQIRYLQKQRGVNMGMMENGTKEQIRNYDAQVSNKIWQIRSECK